MVDRSWNMSLTTFLRMKRSDPFSQGGGNLDFEVR
jgi:hypothetical protein